MPNHNTDVKPAIQFFFQPTKAFKKVDTDKKKEEIEKMKAKFGLNEDE